MVTYNDVFIGYGDQKFIDELADELGVDYGGCEYSWGACFANDIIYYIYSEAIGGLEVSENTRGKLMEGIFTNCIDSRVSISSNNIDEGDLEMVENLEWVNVY